MHHQGMTIEEAVHTINWLRGKSSLNHPERRQWAAAWAVLVEAGNSIHYQAWLGGQLWGEGDTEAAAIADAVAEYERTIGYGDESHLYPNREALEAAMSVSIAARVPWQRLQLYDLDHNEVTDPDVVRAVLEEYMKTGAINGYYFARFGWAHEDLEDVSTWGPLTPDAVDWTGF